MSGAQVPSLSPLPPTEAARGPRPAPTVNDEVAAILQGLKLDKAFFVNRLQPGTTAALLPKVPAGEKPLNHLVNEAVPGQGVLTGKKAPGNPLHSDFDIYLNEALMPTLAQALDALTRQLARMDEQGDALDPKVRARFNPLTFLGQQLLRRHPRCARTPRRTALYKNFKDLADYEKGRREMLRLGRTEILRKTFNGFMLKGAVSAGAISSVIDAFDDALHLNGVLKNHVEMQKVPKMINPSAADGSKRGGGVVTFEKFWYHFSEAVVGHDIVPYSALERGKTMRAKEADERAAWEAEQAQREEERILKEATDAELERQYKTLYQKLKANVELTAICEEGKILTGDDMRPGDTGYEFEVRPIGLHITLLAEMLVLLGFEHLQADDQEMAMGQRPSNAHKAASKDAHGTSLLRANAQTMAAHAAKVSKGNEFDRYYDKEIAEAWMIIQKTLDAEIVDGVLEAETLIQFLVPPSGFILLKGKVEDEVERQLNEGKKNGGGMGLELDEKPSMEELCTRHGITNSRLEWLHELFESFLEADPEFPDRPPVCLYPEMPASLNRVQMMGIIGDINPGLTGAEFNARFQRIDTDGSGMIEFDEFVMWISADEVKIGGPDGEMLKMTFEELAHQYKESVELIEYLHDCFQDQLGADTVDDYPDEPEGLAKPEAMALAQMLIPSLGLAEFELQFEMVDATSREFGQCDFDEFLELIDFAQLPAELRDRVKNEN